MMTTEDSLDIIKNYLIKRKQTISVAESVTAGLLQSVISNCEGAVDYFQGGITTYNIGQKCRHLSIDPIHPLSCNCVSEKMADDMATSVCELFTSDWGIAVTGYASPVPESHNQLFAYFAIALNGKSIHTQKLETSLENPREVQMYYVEKIIEALVKVMNLPKSKDLIPQGQLIR